MGLFSTIRIAMKCEECAWLGEVDVQFKYGNLYDHRYGLGSAIVWGRTQVGNREERRVAVQGIAGCPTCDADNFFDILIDGGIVVSVGRWRGRYDYRHGEGNYIVLCDGDAGR